MCVCVRACVFKCVYVRVGLCVIECEKARVGEKDKSEGKEM